MSLLSATEGQDTTAEVASPGAPMQKFGPPSPGLPGTSPLPAFSDTARLLYGDDGQGGAKAAEVEQAKIRAAAMRPEYAKINESLQSQETLGANRPPLPITTPPPSRGLRDFLAVSENESPVASIAKLLQAMSLFANVAVGGSRHNAVGALAAFTGALDGWHKGDAERADRSFKDWEAQTNQAITEYKLQRDDYHDALLASGKTIEGRMRMAELKARALGDDAAVLSLTSGNLESYLKFQAERDDKMNNLEVAKDKAAAAWAKATAERRPATLSERYAKAVQDSQENPNDPEATRALIAAVIAVNQEEKLAGIKAGAAETAKGEADLRKPLTPKQAEGMILPKTLSGPPAGMTMGDAIARGYVETDEKDRGVIADLQQTRAIVGTLKSMTDKLITAKTPSEAIAQYADLNKGAMTGSNPMARLYSQTSASFLGTVSRALAGERGVLTNQDLSRIKAAFPGFFDTKAVADAKSGVLDLLVTTAYEARVAKMTKQPIDATGLRTQIDGLISQLESQKSGYAPPPGAPGSPWREKK